MIKILPLRNKRTVERILQRVQSDHQQWFEENSGRGGIYEFFEIREQDNFPILRNPENMPPTYIMNHIYDLLGIHKK